MPFFELEKDKIGFPPAHFADQNGLLAIGGDITAEWLLAAYKSGIYLWSSPIEEYSWWSPDPRLVLFPEDLEISEQIQALLNGTAYTFSTEDDFAEVMRFCEQTQNKGEMSAKWLMGSLIAAYKQLKEDGLARALTVRQNGIIKSAVFGTKIESVFFLEYVCATDDTEAILALVALIHALEKEGLKMVDVQKETYEFPDIGLREISRNEYVSIIK
ncbi:MAG: hypothetical protein R2792_12235 [Saprospiraceae bacterium]